MSEQVTIDSDTQNLWILGNAVEGVLFSMNQPVQIVSGSEMGAVGTIISLYALGSDPLFTLRLATAETFSFVSHRLPTLMTEHLLTLELSPDRDELRLHANVAGLRFLSAVLSRLADRVASTGSDHIHLMTEDWGGHELSSVLQGETDTLIHHLKIYGWTQPD